MVQFRSIRVNPLRVASSLFLVIAPLLSWITVSAFGLTAEATLLDLAGARAPLSIPSLLPLVSVLATILIIVGGLMFLRVARTGLAFATTGLGMFVFEAQGLFGSPVSIVPVVIAPGIGLLTAVVGVGVGAASFRVQSQETTFLIKKVWTRQSLTSIGLFTATVSLVLDGLSHAGLGQISAFLGEGLIEPVFHMGVLASVGLLVFLFDVRKRYSSVRLNSALVATSFAFIILDAAYHTATGSVSGFLGHDWTEVLLHVSAYYGTAFLVIARLFKA